MAIAAMRLTTEKTLYSSKNTESSLVDACSYIRMHIETWTSLCLVLALTNIQHCIANISQKNGVTNRIASGSIESSRRGRIHDMRCAERK